MNLRFLSIPVILDPLKELSSHICLELCFLPNPPPLVGCQTPSGTPFSHVFCLGYCSPYHKSPEDSEHL